MGLGYFGALALHIWTCFLVYYHWGEFCALLAFFSPFFSEAVVLVACFWWGVWFYSVAVVLLLTLFLGGMTLSETPERDSTHFGAACVCWAVALVLLSAVFGYSAREYAITPRPMTAEFQRELDDVSAAVVQIIAGEKDSARAAQMPEAKAILRKSLKKYDERSLDEICRQVNTFMLVYRCSIKDSKIFINEVANTPGAKYKDSAETKAALAAMPKHIHSVFTLPPESATDSAFREFIGGDNPQSVKNWKEMFEWSLSQRMKTAEETYQDLLGRPAPDSN